MSYNIVVKDQVDGSITTKLQAIASAAATADKGIVAAVAAMKTLGAAGASVDIVSRELVKLTRLSASLAEAQSRLAVADLKVATAKQRLATETRKTEIEELKLEAALNRAVIAEDKAAISAQKLAAQQFNASTAAQKLATEQQRTNEAANKAQTALIGQQAAQSKVAAEAAKAATAQQNLAAATSRAQAAATGVTIAQNRVAVSAQQVAAATSRANAAQSTAAGASARAAAAQQTLVAAAARARTAITNAATAAVRNASAMFGMQAAADRAAAATLRLQQQQERASRSTSNLSRSMIGLLRDFAIITGLQLDLRSMVELLDKYTLLQNKLRTVAEGQAQVNVLTDKLREIANNTRAPVEDTTKAFTRFDLALKGLGKSQQDTLNLTETVNKALVLGGANTAEQSAALLQLSQAFNKGKLDGDEFRSVMELMPIAADAIAKQLGVTRGELKQLAPEGKITAQVIIDAFNNASKEINEKFARTIPTIGQSLTVLANNFTVAFGKMVQASGVTKAIANGILLISNNLETILPILATVGAAMIGFFGVNLVTAVGNSTRAMAALNAVMALNPYALVAAGIAAATAAVIIYGDEISIGSDKTVTLKDYAIAAWDGIKYAIGATFKALKEWVASAYDLVTSFFGFLLDKTKSVANFIVNSFTSALKIIETTWDHLPQAVDLAYFVILDYTADTVERFVNFWINGINTVSDWAKSHLPDFIGSKFGNVDSFKIDRTTGIMGSTRGEVDSYMSDIRGLFSGSAFSKDPVGKMIEGAMDIGKDIFGSDFLGLKSGYAAWTVEADKISNRRIADEKRRMEEEERARKALNDARPFQMPTGGAGDAGKVGKRVGDPNFAGDGSDLLRQKFVESMRSMVGLAKEAESCAKIVREGSEKAGLHFGVTAKAMDGLSSGRNLASSFFGEDVSKFKKRSEVLPGDLVAFKKTYGDFGEAITHVATVTEVMKDGTLKIIDTSSAAGRRIGAAAQVVERVLPKEWESKIVGYATPKALLGTGRLTDQQISADKASSKALNRLSKNALGFAAFESKAEKAHREETEAQLSAAQIRDYNLALQVNKELFDKGQKSGEQYRAMHHILNEELRGVLEPMSQYNDALAQEEKLAGMTTDARNLYVQMQEFQNEALKEGTKLSKEDLAVQEQRLINLQRTNRETEIANQLLDNSLTRKREQRNSTFVQIAEMTRSGALNAQDSQQATVDALGGLGIDVQLLEENLGLVKQKRQELYDWLTQKELEQNANSKIYAAARQQMDQEDTDIRLGYAKEFFGNMTALSSSGNKKLAAIGKAAAIAQAMISTYQGAAKALELGPILGPIMAASVVVAGLAQVAQIRSQNVEGFKLGGYTGNGSPNAVAGVVHGREFVMNAQATSRIGVGNLQRLQDGNVQGAFNTPQSVQQAPPVVNVAAPQVLIVDSKESALSAFRGSEGDVIFMEKIERNGTTIARVLNEK